MDNQQLLMFKGWFIDSYPECKDYLDLTYFDVEKNTFLSKCSYNPDSGNAAKVLKIAFGSWQHQQAKVEELEGVLQSKQALLDKVWTRTAEMNKDLDEVLEREKGVIKVIESMRNKVKHGHMEDEVAQMLSSFANDLKQALHGECTHESDGSFLLSDPPRTKCKKCGEFYFKALKPNNEVLRGQVVKKIEEFLEKNEQERRLWDVINGGEQALKGEG
ncbi:hypothetical protein [Acinetobacter baumannii]|uniref:hypothetical protein n=1 Tax=Acinetobacter baumannii TaxID=470 RepID=UPI0025A08856|nr:hypothetical protein [Acinetobacter baumannii]